MNELTKLLAEQANCYCPKGLPSDWNDEDYIVSPLELEMFANLIVQECVTQLRKEGERAKIQAFTGSTYKFTYMNEAANVIKRHFGWI